MSANSRYALLYTSTGSKNCAGNWATVWTACAGFVLIEDAEETIAPPRHGKEVHYLEADRQPFLQVHVATGVCLLHVFHKIVPKAPNILTIITGLPMRPDATPVSDKVRCVTLQAYTA